MPLFLGLGAKPNKYQEVQICLLALGPHTLAKLHIVWARTRWTVWVRTTQNVVRDDDVREFPHRLIGHRGIHSPDPIHLRRYNCHGLPRG